MSLHRSEARDPSWDDHRAADLPGTTAIFTLRYVDPEGDDIGIDVFTGLVTRADEEEGIEIEIFQPTPGETVVLAPVLEAFQPAEPGFYELEDDNLTIEDPDWLVDIQIVITAPGEQLGMGVVN